MYERCLLLLPSLFLYLKSSGIESFILGQSVSVNSNMSWFCLLCFYLSIYLFIYLLLDHFNYSHKEASRNLNYNCLKY